jgi:hypothetical protein
VLLLRDGSVEVFRPDGRTVTIPSAGDYDAVVFIPSVLSLDGGIYDMSYSVQMSTSFNTWSDLSGDFDHSGTVGFEDFLTFSQSFGKPASDQHGPSDFNADGSVDFNGFLVFAGRFGNTR